jgi:hypothetical protein
MVIASEVVEAAISEVAKAHAFVSKIKSKQITGTDTLATLKSTAYAWFMTHRSVITSAAPTLDLADVDRHYYRSGFHFQAHFKENLSRRA